MDDEAIARIRNEVLSQLDAPQASAAGSDLEARVAALESAVSQLLARSPRSLPVVAEGRHAHPSLASLDLGGATDRCLMEPDKPCVQSHACRTFGH